MTKLLPRHEAMLDTSNWYRRLPTGVRDLVRDQLAVSGRLAGRTLFHQGDAPAGLHVILSGEFHVTGTAADGISALMGILRPGDWTGFLAALDDNPYAFTVGAVVDSEVACLPIPAVHAIFEHDVAIYKLLVAPELVNARRNYHFFMETYGRSPLKRVAERLMELGRWPYSPRSGPVAPVDVSQDTLAAATRLTRQTINTLLRELEGRGLVELGYGRIKVKDAAALGRLVHQTDAGDEAESASSVGPPTVTAPFRD